VAVHSESEQKFWIHTRTIASSSLLFFVTPHTAKGEKEKTLQSKNKSNPDRLPRPKERPLVRKVPTERECQAHENFRISRLDTRKQNLSVREKNPENKSNAKKQEINNNLEKLHRNQWWRKGNAAPVPCENHHHKCPQRLIQKTHTKQKHPCSNRDYCLFSSSKFTQKSSENRREGGESDDGLSHETRILARKLPELRRRQIKIRREERKRDTGRARLWSVRAQQCPLASSFTQRTHLSRSAYFEW
jgi:hypothetical protein